MKNNGKVIRSNQSWTALVFLSLIFSACQRDTKPPLTPEDALKTFSLPDGFRIELVASEPQISDPVEIAFDADGFLYVAEMEDYPAGAAPGGRIVMLEDVDGDGHYEKADVFADSLPYVNGVMPWRKGVLVTSAPDILYLEDTDGDRRADVREVLITGFAFTNPQLRMSSLRYGLDNWIYGAYSRAGGQRGYPEFADHGKAITFPSNPARDSADIYPGTDFRFRPDSFLIEPAGGMSQFGMAFDEAGNRFTVWNNIHARHVVMDARYTATNLYLNVNAVMADISDHGNAATVYSRAENRLDLHESEIGHFTSACGHSIYTGGLFPAPYDGALFVCEPVSNIVHMDVLSRNGATFTASRHEDGKEFLSSTDSWFRPVNTTVGPDGALYVVDFYRKLVEHPAWISRADEKGIYTHAGVLQEEDFIEGNDRGRIYRIVWEGPGLSAGSVTELSLPVGEPAGPHPGPQLVELLSHKNYFWRIHAQRLLVERQDTSVVPALRELLAESTSAKARVHALRTLEGLHALNEAILLTALRDDDAFVRKQAVLVAEPYLSQGSIREQILGMTSDENVPVQFQVAMTVSLLPSEISFPKLLAVARGHMSDEWFRKALLLSARDNALQWLHAVRSFPDEDVNGKVGKAKFLRQLAGVAGRRGDAREISRFVTAIASEKDSVLQHAVFAGLVDGLPHTSGRLTLSTAAQDALVGIITSGVGEVQSASISVAEKVRFERWPQLWRAIGHRIDDLFDPQSPIVLRQQTVRILGLNPQGVDVPIFRRLLGPEQPNVIQSAATRALILREDTSVLQLLCESYNASAPEVRAIIEGGFMRSATRVNFLVDALERGLVDPALLSPAFRSRLVQHPQDSIAQRARKLVANVVADSRTAVVNDYYESTLLTGDAVKGKALFRSRCSTCHLLGGEGRAFGPDLLSVTNQTRINLLTMIIDPNNNIAPGYDGYFVETKEGRTLTGILVAETASGVMFRTADGNDENISRTSIETLRPMRTSLMPEGLEAGLTKLDMADLLEYLKKGGCRVPGARCRVPGARCFVKLLKRSEGT